MAHEWVKEFPGRVEVCDREGVLVEMNDRASTTSDPCPTTSIPLPQPGPGPLHR
jgi:hypothetical protein